MTKTVTCDKCNGRGYFTFEQRSQDLAGVTVCRCEVCQGKGTVDVPVTNADHVRSETDEELALRFADAALAGPIRDLADEGTVGAIKSAIKNDIARRWLYWLKQPYKEG